MAKPEFVEGNPGPSTQFVAGALLLDLIAAIGLGFLLAGEDDFHGGVFVAVITIGPLFLVAMALWSDRHE